MSPEINVRSPSELLDQVKITHERDDNIAEGYVPIELINQEDVPVDNGHVQDLTASIEKQSTKHEKTGQLSPVLLAAIPGEKTFRIIDGFHRTAALTAMEEGEVYATVKKDATIEDVVDLRITAAKSHQKVKFSRIVEWIEEAWSMTDWSSTISASTAFTMEMLENTGGHSGLTAEEVSEAKEWVQQKCEQWDIKVNQVDRYLRVAKKADPALVARVRDRRGGHKLEDITSAHLTQIVRLLPNEHVLQNIVADAAVANTLTVSETNSLALTVSRAKTYEAIDQYIDSKVWKSMGSASAALRKRRYQEIDGDNTSNEYVTTLQDKFFDDQVAIAELLIENAIMTGLYTPNPEDKSGALMELTVRLGLDGETNSTGQEDIDAITEDTNGHAEWDLAKIGGLAERTFELHSFLTSIAIRRYSFDGSTAEDLASESTIALLNAADKDRVDAAIEGVDLRKLMTRIMINKSLDEIRKGKGALGNTRMVTLATPDGELSNPIDSLGAEDDNLEKLLDVTENPDFTKTILPYLTERERRVTVLRGVFGLENKEVAAVLGTSIGTVNALMHRLKTKVVDLGEKVRLESINL